MTFEFTVDTYRWEAADRQFLLMEPPTLFGESRLRTDVQARRVDAGWHLVGTRDDESQLTLTDLWTRQATF